MTVFSILSFAEQGVYDVVVNGFGSVLSRNVLFPIEDSSYFYFAQMLNRSVSIEKQERNQVEKIITVFRRLLRSLSLYGATVAVFGYSYSHLILYLCGGQTLTEGAGPLLLKTHCLTVWFFAISGITEAYIFAAMSHKELDKYNWLMVFLSAFCFGLSCLLSRLLGSVGFILANCVNMALRIGYRWLIAYPSV